MPENEKRLRIAIGGSAANPPHLGHKQLLWELLNSRLFDKVIWIPSGERYDKNLVEPEHRVAMTFLAVNPEWLINPGGCQLILDLNDVYHDNTPTIGVLRRERRKNSEAELTWFTGSDSVIPRQEYGGLCEIEEKWTDGKELMKNWNFLIVPRPNFPISSDLNHGPNFKILKTHYSGLEISSDEIRELIKTGQSFEHLLVPAVAGYIKAHKLYGYHGVSK